MRTHISGSASNNSLGPMLGLLPAFAGFFGLGLDVRHVTLPAGQTAALHASASFYFAFRLALRAHSASPGDRAHIRRAIRARWRSRPVRFFLPP